jgi:hypothetical protein
MRNLSFQWMRIDLEDAVVAAIFDPFHYRRSMDLNFPIKFSLLVQGMSYFGYS